MNKTAVLKSLNTKFSLSPECSKVLVVGLGITGYSISRFLHDYGFNFAVMDSRKSPPFIEELTECMPDLPVFTGDFDKKLVSQSTHLLISPGVSLKQTVFDDAIRRGVAIVSDIDLFACAVIKPVIAITGSNGKSTVTTMVAEMVKAAGVKAAVGGNLGTPVLDLIEENTALYILELSSFQLERTSVLEPVAAAVLNISPDHMDRYLDISDYAAQKNKIFKGQGVMVLNADDTAVLSMRLPDRKTVTFSCQGPADIQLQSIKGMEWIIAGHMKILPVADLSLKGRHNLENAMAALALGKAVDLPVKVIIEVLTRFKGLEHRMQKVAEINGVVWINDSKATNVGACIAALQGLEQSVVLIAGGDSKGAEMNELVSVIREKVKAVILMGKDAELIERVLNGCVPSSKVDTVEQAVIEAAILVKPGESVLLSPACASLDQFKNYQERGRRFEAAVRSLAA